MYKVVASGSLGSIQKWLNHASDVSLQTGLVELFLRADLLHASYRTLVLTGSQIAKAVSDSNIHS